MSVNPFESEFWRDTVLTAVFWISAWQMASALTDHLPKRKQLLIFSILALIALVFLFLSSKKKEADKKI